MKKITLLIASFALVFGAYAQTNSSCSTCDVAPNLAKTTSNYDKALWDIQLDVDPVAAFSPNTGLAGIAWTGTEFWVTKWANNVIYTANASGVMTGNFTIAGVTGARSITTDGTDMYIGTATNKIYKINKTTKTLTSTITTSVTSCRYVTYVPTLNSNAGGFMVGEYASAITAVSMTGTTLSTIAPGTHTLTGIYGLAYDPYSTGGPFLWAFDQGGNGADIVQLTMAGVPTGQVHDATIDLQGGNTGVAGGLFICNNLVSGKNSMIGMNQGASLFSYELADPPTIDAKMDAISNANYIAAGNVTIAGTIRNNGSTPITSMNISWNSGSGPNPQTFTVNVAPFQTYNFSHGTQLAAVAGNTYNITVTVTVAGDAITTNNSLTTSVTALTQIPSKKVVGEEKTGTWCQWCPRGAVGLAYMEAQANFIGIAVHNNDPMAIAAYDGNIGTYIPGGYPGGGVDRVLVGDPNPTSFLTMHNQRKNTIVPCDVKNIVAYLNTTTNQISVSAQSEWYGTIPGNYRLSCVLVEDDFNSSNQSNAYAGGGNGTMAFPAGKNNSYDFGGVSSPSSVPSTAFLGYDHVAKSLSGNSILGQAGSLPASPVPAGVHSYTFANVPSSVISNPAKAHAVVMVINTTTGEILNAEIAPLSVGNSVNDLAAAQYALNVYPNPTNAVSTISFNLPEANLVTMDVYNTMGSLVYTSGSINMNQGKQNLSFNGTELTNGIYFINLTIGNELITKKVSLLK
jgi:hypothetical protein